MIPCRAGTGPGVGPLRVGRTPSFRGRLPFLPAGDRTRVASRAFLQLDRRSAWLLPGWAITIS
jgi:hypothetical protein